MVFTHDTEAALQAAVMLVNTIEEQDGLTSVEQLSTFLDDWDYTGRHDADDAELAEVRDLCLPLRGLLLAERDAAVEIVNQMLAEADATPQLVRHGRHDWHIHAIESDAPLARRIVVETAMAMIDVIRADEMSRLGVCADDECDGIVLDLSRNRSRRFCSTTCTNRNAVAAYRARHADS